MMCNNHTGATGFAALTCVLLHVVKTPLKVDRDISLHPCPAFTEKNCVTKSLACYCRPQRTAKCCH